MADTLKWYFQTHNRFPKYERDDISFVNHSTKHILTAAGDFVAAGFVSGEMEIHCHGSSNNDAWPSSNNHLGTVETGILHMSHWVEDESAGALIGLYAGDNHGGCVQWGTFYSDWRDPVGYRMECDVAGYASGGWLRGIFFRTFPKAFLDGKKIGFKWSAWRWTGEAELSTAYCVIYDGAYAVYSITPTDFPEGATMPTKGNGLLQTVATLPVRDTVMGPGDNEDPADDWVTQAPVTIDVSGASEDTVTLMFYFDGPSVEEIHDFAVTGICIYDDDDILLYENQFNPDTESDAMEFLAYETCQDHGYVQEGEVPPPEEEPEPEPLPDDDYFAKGGKNMFLNKGVVIPQFTVSELPGITFGGFIADKYINSQPKATPSNGSPTVAAGGSPGGTASKSTVGVPAWDYVMLSHAMVACCNRGKGWHLLTPFEWAALAWMSEKMGSQPHGGNGNTNPPSDADRPYEEAELDRDLFALYPTYKRALPGTGPSAWAHTGKSLGGVYDLQGLVWQWLMGFMTTEGYLRYPANFEVGYLKSPYGRGTITGVGGASPTLTCDGIGGNWLKSWTADEFNGSSYSIFIAEADGGEGYLYESIQDTTPTTLVLPASTPELSNGVATFVILKTLVQDISSGMVSDYLIDSISLDLASDLSRLAFPLSSSAAGSSEFGYDIFSFSKGSGERGMVRGGCFSDGKGAGVFAMSFNNNPVTHLASIGFRAAKAI